MHNILHSLLYIVLTIEKRTVIVDLAADFDIDRGMALYQPPVGGIYYW